MHRHLQALLGQAATAWRCLEDELFPARCLLCEAPAGEILPGWCPTCAATIPWRSDGCVPRPWRVVACHLDDPVRSLIYALKYGGQRRAAVALAGVLEKAVREADLPRLDLLVPVPLFWLKQLTRGFNQAELLADALAAGLGTPAPRRLLRRVRATQALSEARSPGQRARILAGSLRSRREPLGGLTIGLVDDVFTTGATTRACSRLLRAAGARRVIALCVAGT